GGADYYFGVARRDLREPRTDQAVLTGLPADRAADEGRRCTREGAGPGGEGSSGGADQAGRPEHSGQASGRQALGLDVRPRRRRESEVRHRRLGEAQRSETELEGR